MLVTDSISKMVIFNLKPEYEREGSIIMKISGLSIRYKSGGGGVTISRYKRPGMGIYMVTSEGQNKDQIHGTWYLKGSEMASRWGWGPVEVELGKT